MNHANADNVTLAKLKNIPESNNIGALYRALWNSQMKDIKMA